MVSAATMVSSDVIRASLAATSAEENSHSLDSVRCPAAPTALVMWHSSPPHRESANDTLLGAAEAAASTSTSSQRLSGGPARVACVLINSESCSRAVFCRETRVHEGARTREVQYASRGNKRAGSCLVVGVAARGLRA